LKKKKIHTGTAVMTVGFNTAASPFVPRLILLDVSIIVNGVEYPILIPHNKQASSVINK